MPEMTRQETQEALDSVVEMGKSFMGDGLEGLTADLIERIGSLLNNFNPLQSVETTSTSKTTVPQMQTKAPSPCGGGGTGASPCEGASTKVQHEITGQVGENPFHQFDPDSRDKSQQILDNLKGLMDAAKKKGLIPGDMSIRNTTEKVPDGQGGMVTQEKTIIEQAMDFVPQEAKNLAEKLIDNPKDSTDLGKLIEGGKEMAEFFGVLPPPKGGE